jgi:hypothetical protein
MGSSPSVSVSIRLKSVHAPTIDQLLYVGGSSSCNVFVLERAALYDYLIGTMCSSSIRPVLWSSRTLYVPRRTNVPDGTNRLETNRCTFRAVAGMNVRSLCAAR